MGKAIPTFFRQTELHTTCSTVASFGTNSWALMGCHRITLPSNYQTDTAQLLMQGEFPFVEKRVLLVVGFRIDSAMQQVERVEIQRFRGNTMQFYIELEKVARKSKVVTMPSDLTATKAKTRVTIKRGPEQEEMASGD
jgi:hypothetical protein